MKELKLIGNIGKKEMRFTPQGKAVCEFSLAVTVKKGEEKQTEWFKVVAWEKVAEIINQYADVGSKMYVSGVPSLETWNDKESGEARGKMILTVREFEFLSRAKEQADEPAF